MSSSYSVNTARPDELPNKEKMIWEYSGNSESIVGASSSRGFVRGQEEASTSGRDDQALGDSILDDLFTYPAPAHRQRVESPDTASSMRAPSTELHEEVGTSRLSQDVASPNVNEERLVVEIPQLRDESLNSVEPSFRVKSEELNWDYNPLIEAERPEAWAGSGSTRVRKTKKKKKRKQRPPPGSTWCDEESLDDLREECGIPDSVEFILPSLEQREDDPPENTFTAYECWFRDCYLTFPIPLTILRFMWVHKIALAQINSRGVRQLVGLLTRAAECGESVGVRQLINLLDFRRHNVPGAKKLYNLASRAHYKVLDDFPNKDHNWRNFFFFVSISAASVEEENARLAKWGTLVRRPIFTPAPGIDDLFEKLKARRCLWERHFNLRRVIQARKSAINVEEDHLYRSDSEDFDIMPERPSFRDQQKAAKAKAAAAKDKKKKDDPKDATPSAEVSERSVANASTPAVMEEVAAADASGALAVAPSQTIVIEDEHVESENQLIRNRKRKHSASEKGKGKTGEGKSRRRLPTLISGQPIPQGSQSRQSPAPGDIYDDPAAAAALMSRVTYPGDNFPIPEMLLKSELYKEFASRQAKAVAHNNRLILSYEQEARSRQAFIDEAKEREVVEKREVAEKMASLTAELEATKKSADDSFRHLHDLTIERTKDEERMVEQAKEIAALKASRESDMEAAASEARRTAAAEVQAHLTKAHDLFERLMKKPFEHAVFLEQAKANLQLLADIEHATDDEPFDPAVERAEITEGMAKFKRASDAFDKIAAELKQTLGKNYVVPVNVRDLVFSPRLETLAKSVGVNTASGSNDGSMGLRLLEDDERLSDSDEAQEVEPMEVDESVARNQEVASVVPQSELAPSDPVVEKATVEATSSTAPAAQIEIEKEAGEL